MIDCRIRRARIVDGCGNPWFRGDVGIDRGRIVAVGDLTGVAARRDLDAAELCLAPGFVDPHTHSDFKVPRFPRGESKISQGVTTEVGGNCGLSPFPVHPDRLDLLRQYTAFTAPDLAWDWRTTGDFLRYLESLSLSHNLVALLGHGSVRVAVMGFDDRVPTAAEMEEMKALVAEGMEAGVAGLSSGLIYAPGIFSRPDELVELCRVVARYGGIYTTHLRNEAGRLLQSVEEAITVGREAGVPVEISHHKAVGESNWGMVKQSLAMVKEARRQGVDVTSDQYPYTGSSTTVAAFLPEWSMEGGIGKLLERIADPETRVKMLGDAPAHRGTIRWEQVVMATARHPEHRQYEGMSVEEIGRRRGKPPYETVLELIQEAQGPFSAIHFSMCEEDVEYVLRDPTVMVGSDGSSMNPEIGGKPHPRNYATCVRVLARYVRERGVLTLEEAVRKMTSMPAQRFGLFDRGVVRPGGVADLVLFDPERVQDTATFINPHQYATGVAWTMVAGEIVWQEGRDTGASPGKLLRATPRKA